MAKGTLKHFSHDLLSVLWFPTIGATLICFSTLDIRVRNDLSVLLGHAGDTGRGAEQPHTLR